MSESVFPPGRRWLRRALWVSLAVAVVALGHGIYLPQALVRHAIKPLLEDRAVRLDFDGAVLSLLPRPRLRLLSVKLSTATPDNQGSSSPLLTAGLLGMGFVPKAWHEPGWMRIESLQLKQATLRIAAEPNESLNWNAWRRVPPRSDRPFVLPDVISLQNITISAENIFNQSAEIFIDRAHWNGATAEPVYLAMRVRNARLNGTLQVQGTSEPLPDTTTAIHLTGDFRGDFDGYPWSVTLAIDRARPADKTRPGLAEGFRIYIKRDDDPDEHQAVLSAAQARFYPYDGRLFVRQGEWTYTHEKAEAWTFDAVIDQALRIADIQPLIVPGSEAIAAPAQQWRWPCPPFNHTKDGTYWWWESGWWQDKAPTRPLTATPIVANSGTCLLVSTPQPSAVPRTAVTDTKARVTHR